jgi:hypothetical protein
MSTDCVNPHHDHEDEAVAGWFPDSGRHETVCFTRLDRAVIRAKREILDDVSVGRVPIDVSDFAELHDYVDANEYGGLCDPALEGSEQWRSEVVGPDDDDDEGNDRWITFGNALQDRVNAWIEGGGLR